ncbi:MAG: hypothetical protein IT536_15065 [Hyphomicrobiales bacterium]|nr:hypothetical protein [Hyphomicrobiales bacterium]
MITRSARSVAVGLAVSVAAVALAATAAQAQCPNLSAKPISGRIELSEFFLPDPSRHRVIAGGSQNLARCRSNWKGWVSSSPDLQLQYNSTGGTALSIAVESNMDTVVLVNDPSGTWHYNDDGGRGLNGKVRFPRARQGRYDIWVGTFKEGRGNLPPVTVSISEN